MLIVAFFVGGGVLLLAFGAQAAWRSFHDVRKSAHVLTAYAAEEAERLDAASERLTQHGITLHQTSTTLFPKVRRVLDFLERPVAGAVLPWILRRLFGRPFRKRG